MDRPSGQKKWPFWRGDRFAGVTVGRGSTVLAIL